MQGLGFYSEPLPRNLGSPALSLVPAEELPITLGRQLQPHAKAPGACFRVQVTQSLQNPYPLIKEYTLNYNRIPYMI